jgi:predicted regulator of Ras-like GTPase activity (Roadblock/LC7/MglB family)
VETEFERLRKKVENFPSASAYNRLAELARLNGGAAEAMAICQRCIKEFPRNGQSYVILAEIALTEGRKADAISLLKDAVERDVRSYSGHRMLADHYEEAQDYANALRHLKMIQAFRPADAGVLDKIKRLQPLVGANPSTQTSITSMQRSVTSAVRSAVANGARAPEPRTTTTARQDALSGLCAEQGVQGAVVADAQGRVVLTRGIADDVADVLAALACDMAAAQRAVFAQCGAEQLTGWTVDAEAAQIIAFQREPGLTLAVLAKPGVRAALLELRARQALIDLGAA